jgi:hypothetical protein
VQSYTIEFSGSGEVLEKQLSDDTAAQAWAESVIADRGFDAEELFSGQWDADGQNDADPLCSRMLFWECESDAEIDSGIMALCQLCKVGK